MFTTDPFSPYCLSTPNGRICIKGIRAATNRSSSSVKPRSSSGIDGKIKPLAEHNFGTLLFDISLKQVEHNCIFLSCPNVLIVFLMVSVSTLFSLRDCSDVILIDPLNHSCEQEPQTKVGPLFTVALNMSINSLNDLLFR